MSGLPSLFPPVPSSLPPSPFSSFSPSSLASASPFSSLRGSGPAAAGSPAAAVAPAFASSAPRPAAERIEAMFGSRGGEPLGSEAEEEAGFATGPGRAPAPGRRVVEAVADRVPARFRVGVDRRVVAAVAVLALVAVALAVVGWWRARPQSVEAPATAAGSVSTVAATGHSAGDQPTPAPVVSASAGPITVHVAGKVVRPGVVVLPPGSRVADALQAAGGPLPAADLATLNLARPLADGEQVPVGVPGAPAAVPGAAPGALPAGPSAPAGPLDLNSATAEQLEQLPGVGPVLARQILEKRTQLGGRFASIDQLRQVRGIGDRKFTDIKPKVRV